LAPAKGGEPGYSKYTFSVNCFNINGIVEIQYKKCRGSEQLYWEDITYFESLHL
jgi:hypothetical protein